MDQPDGERALGLLELERDRAMREDGHPVGPEEIDPPRRDVFVATLRGRPDLKPGDLVAFEAPEASAAGEELGFALGPAPMAPTGSRVTAYIQEVTHRLSREQGFLTIVRCVAAASGDGDLVDRVWCRGADPNSAAADASSGESSVANAFGQLRHAARNERWPDVAQVRAHHVAGDPQPAQTERLWRGLADGDGLARGAARLAFAESHKDLGEVPYATPFAYGKCGLVVPRYPGTRVFVVNRGGDPDDPVDVGALWARGQGPDEAQVGDWWLSLPVGVDGTNPRASVGDDERPEPQKTDATNDLIDAHGNRVIEVGTLTIRIGRNKLERAGKRPQVAEEPVSIEHDSGNARITIDQHGAITISTDKKLTLRGADGVAVETGGDISMTVGGHVKMQQG